jgi:hypothetical protein
MNSRRLNAAPQVAPRKARCGIVPALASTMEESDVRFGSKADISQCNRNRSALAPCVGWQGSGDAVRAIETGLELPVARETLDDGGCNGDYILGDRRNHRACNRLRLCSEL